MKLDKRTEYYLRQAHIDFSAFCIMEIIPQNKENAVILLSPTSNAPHKYFAVKHCENTFYYGSIENMMDVCVENKFISRRKAKRLIKKYYSITKGSN